MARTSIKFAIPAPAVVKTRAPTDSEPRAKNLPVQSLSYPAQQADLANLAMRGRLRTLQPARGLDFSSNDYLGLARSPYLQRAAVAALERGVPVGSGGSRLLRGNHTEHEALETEAAQFFGAEAALFMGGGFQANQAIFATLPAKTDLVLYDALIHASVHEGLLLRQRHGQAVGQAQPFAHNDVAAASDAIRAWRAGGGQEGAKGRIWLAIESIYSMEGDMAPLADFAALARQHDAVLVVDEAHATGVHGKNGAGFARHLPGVCLLTLHTCGKGLGAAGALVCGDRPLIDLLVARARPFIFATAPSPLSAAIVRAALRLLRDTPEIQTAAQDRIAHAHAEADRLCGLRGFQSQIMPIVVGDDAVAMQLASDLQARGFDVRGIRPPTVPTRTSRLRVSITGNVSNSDITALFEALAACRERRA